MESAPSSRRTWFQQSLVLASSFAATTAFTPLSVLAVPSTDVAAEVTDKIYIDIKGIPASADGGADTTATTVTSATQRIVIGLFGKEAPESTKKLLQLVDDSPQGGLPSACKPKEERVLQREQLEANKVYNSCMENQDKGVNYDYAQIWRVLQGERIDFGSVAGKYVARVPPNWSEAQASKLTHDRPGLVSVRKGSDSGFGFTVYPGGASKNRPDLEDLNENHIIVGQVLEGMDVIERLNNIAVITSSKVNYMALTGGPNNKSAPSRACRYGGAMYCNENKPLVKLTIYKSGVLS